MRKLLLCIFSVFLLAGLTSAYFSKRPAPISTCAAPSATQVMSDDRYPAVFSGSVRQIAKDENRLVVSFDLKHAYKGEIPSDVAVYSDFPGDASCGYTFGLGESYVIMANTDAKGQLEVRSGGVVPLQKADATIATLLHTPVTHSLPHTRFYLFISLAAFIGLLVVIFIKKRA